MATNVTPEFKGHQFSIQAARMSPGEKYTCSGKSNPSNCSDTIIRRRNNCEGCPAISYMTGNLTFETTGKIGILKVKKIS